MSLLCAEYDPARPHGHVTWRVHRGLPVVEIVNNWVCATFEDTYRPPLIANRLTHALRALQPEVLHLHNLLNLSFDLPAMAHAQGVPVVATLHDYTLVCPSGGQRVHRAEQFVCERIDTERCVRCLRDSPIHTQMSLGTLAAAAHVPRPVQRAVLTLGRRLPRLAAIVGQAAGRVSATGITKQDIDARMAAARRVFDNIDLFVAPSPSMTASI